MGILPYIGNNTDSHGDQKCMYCPLSGDVDTDYIGHACRNGSIQQDTCGAVQDGEAFAEWQVKNQAAWETIDATTPFYPSFYVDGDREAHDPLIGPGLGDPSYTGPYG